MNIFSYDKPNLDSSMCYTLCSNLVLDYDYIYYWKISFLQFLHFQTLIFIVILNIFF